jgi:hypothetical protein
MRASAAAEYRRTIELAPSSPMAHFNHGFLTETGRNGVRIQDRATLPRAMIYYRQALEADGDYVPALTNRGICHMWFGSGIWR